MLTDEERERWEMYATLTDVLSWTRFMVGSINPQATGVNSIFIFLVTF